MTETFTTRQVSEVLGVPEATIRSWRFSGAFAAIGRGGEPYIFRPHDVAVLVIGARLSRAGFPPGHSFRVAAAAAGDVIARELSELLAGLRLTAKFGPGAYATRPAQVEAARAR